MHRLQRNSREEPTASAAQPGLVGFLLKLVSWALVAHPDKRYGVLYGLAQPRTQTRFRQPPQIFVTLLQALGILGIAAFLVLCHKDAVRPAGNLFPCSCDVRLCTFETRFRRSLICV